MLIPALESRAFHGIFCQQTAHCNCTCGQCTLADFLCTAIADISSPVKPAATFFFKVFAGLITGGTGSALYAAKHNLAAGIGLFTMVTMDTKVFRIIKRAFVIPVEIADGLLPL